MANVAKKATTGKPLPLVESGYAASLYRVLDALAQREYVPRVPIIWLC
jgi:hypothetical protein